MLSIETTEMLDEAIGEYGFDEALRFSSLADDVDDQKFQELREAYIEAADALDRYIMGKMDE